MSGTAAAGRSPKALRSMSLLSDDRLARRATQGDRRAFEAIFRRYHQDLYRFCLAMAGNPQDAQEALQNTMVKVLRALPGEEREIKLKPWLYRIARNETVEMLRRRREGAELEPDAAAAGVEIAQTVEGRERLRVLLVDLEQLPDRQRAALVMRELAGFDFDQIGEAFDSSAGVARGPPARWCARRAPSSWWAPRWRHPAGPRWRGGRPRASSRSCQMVSRPTSTAAGPLRARLRR